MQIPFANLHARIGIVTESGTYLDLSNPQDFTGNEFGVIVAWPAEYGFLRVQASPQTPPSVPAAFYAAGEAGVYTLFKDLFKEPEALEQSLVDVEDGLAGKEMISGKLRRSQPIRLEISINTEHVGFVQLAEGIASGTAPATLTLDVLLINDQGFEQHSIDLTLGECKPTPPYFGFVAVDLGNTNSSLVALNAGTAQRLKTASVQVLPDERYNRISAARMESASRPTISIIKFERAPNVTALKPEAQTQALAQPDAFEWETGKWVRTDVSLAGIVVGPKRLVARPAGSKKPTVTALDKASLSQPGQTITVPIDSWLPAELFVCRLIQGFQAVVRKRPGKLAVTYPTAYSSRELKQLREAVFRAMKRSRWEAQTDLTASAVDEINPLALDEASAAAFFFLHRRIFEPAGGMRRFKYLYPSGLNLLLYDCGGGTTDIALVRAEATSHEYLKISVLGRAGVRDFGGDNVTIAIFKLLKAKLAQALFGHDETPRDLAGCREPKGFPKGDAVNRDTIEKYFLEMDEHLNAIVPTKFRPGGANLDEIERQRRTMALWVWAERVKESLSKSEIQEVRAQHVVGDALTTTLATPADDKKRQGAIDEIKSKIVVSRAEVDAMVRRDIEDSIKLCNSLIQAKLRNQTEIQDRQVHLVCLAGNGCRYPLVRELLKKRLEVPFIDRDEDRFIYEEQHLKHAVAKGAVLALASQEAGQGVEVEFDRELHDKLPYEIGYRDDTMNAARPLFKEGTHYSAITEPIIMPAPKRRPDASDETQKSRQRYVNLDRRWPGEGIRWSPFLTFQFKKPIEDEVEIYYDQKKHDFVVKHGSEIGQIEVDDRELLYLAPVQRGDL